VQVKGLNDQVGILQSEVDSRESKISTFTQSIDKNKNEKSDLEVKLKTAQDLLTSNSLQAENYDLLNSEISDLKAKIEDSEKQTAMAQEEIEALEEENEELKSKIAELEAQLEWSVNIEDTSSIGKSVSASHDDSIEVDSAHKEEMKIQHQTSVEDLDK